MPKSISIKNNAEFKKAIGYFEKTIKNRRSEYNFTKRYLKLAENCLKWSQKYTKKEEVILRVKYYIFHYYNNQYKAIPETIYRAKELLTFKKFLAMEESMFVLFVLKLAYNDSKQYDKLLKLLPLYYDQQKKFGKPFGETKEDKIVEAEQGLIDAYAHLYYNIKNYKQAQKYFKLQLKYLKSIESHYSISYTRSSCENNIGLSFLNEKKNDSALFYFNSSLKTIHTKIVGVKNIDTAYLNHFINVINANKATIDIDKKEYDIALPILHKVLKSSKETKETHIQLSAYYDLARISYYKENSPHSLKYLDSIFKIIRLSKNNKMMVKALHLKAKNLMLLGNINDANVVFTKHKRLIDSLEQEKTNKIYTEETIKLDVENKTNQLLESRKVIIKKEKIGFYQKVGIGLLLFIILSMLYVYKKFNEKSKIIKRQKIIAEKSLNQKKILLKEIHHRVKNNLQLISGLLYLQSIKHKNKEVTTMINESQKHISSIALVHEMLYKDDTLSLVSMEKYLRGLGTSLLQVSSQENIEYKLSIINVDLPINYATTLGLIINELVINSLKYAFTTKQGIVSVSLKEINENEYIFTYADNGKGFDSDTSTKNTLGQRLIKMLAEEIEADLTVISENGLKYIFNFKTRLK
ncbi:sensor histidine kinase [Tenacibaculum retecalamus]|uniref:sensor histidine kinase n=1 Tax=Tenacibaculum retecalamus TaxID=3018315 RepID=UPI0023D8FB2D|nr:sensor histidine kinase [Tenacibaculum retecalamus]WBX70966.1 sensor histidine kinase [Tenacibaculum retecalamus]